MHRGSCMSLCPYSGDFSRSAGYPKERKAEKPWQKWLQGAIKILIPVCFCTCVIQSDFASHVYFILYCFSVQRTFQLPSNLHSNYAYIYYNGGSERSYFLWREQLTPVQTTDHWRPAKTKTIALIASDRHSASGFEANVQHSLRGFSYKLR
jgi:hypothetical protein